MHSLAVLTQLKPRFAYLLDHFGHARSRRRESARLGESPLYLVNVLPCRDLAARGGGRPPVDLSIYRYLLFSTWTRRHAGSVWRVVVVVTTLNQPINNIN